MVLEGRNIRKSYTLPRSVVHVIRDASISVARGEAVVVLGKSGAGKSTLLHILGGLEEPDQGEVLVNGLDFYSLGARERARIRSREIGFVFQSYHLLPEMDVLENVMLAGMAASGWATSRRRLASRAAALLDAVGLSDRISHRPVELSGGEQQRVAIARALMNSPALILADEPTGNLDAATGGMVLDHLIGLSRKEGRSLVMVTHNESAALRCDRVLVLENGELRAR